MSQLPAKTTKPKYVKGVPKSAQAAALQLRDLALSNMEDQLRVPILQTWPEQGKSEIMVLHELEGQEDAFARAYHLMKVVQGTWRDAEGRPYGGCVGVVFGASLQAPSGATEEALIIDMRESGVLHRFVQRYLFGDEGPEPEGNLAYWAEAFAT